MPPVEDLKNIAPLIKLEEGENGNASGKDRHTIVDEIADNIIKVMIVAFAFIGLGYCTVTFVGKDSGVDPNLAWGYFGGVVTTIIPAYFVVSKLKKEKTNGE